jgi:putative photosynthetic complex assembly protein 2
MPYLWPLAYVVAIWFFGTAMVVALDHLARRRLILGAASVAACLALIVIMATSEMRSATGAYISFGAAFVIWAWHELTFLTGAAAGPRLSPLPANARGWTRFRLSAAAVLTHEIALFLTAILLATLTWDGANQTAAATFALLFILRLSTKLNIYLGVPNFAQDLLPPQLDYLKSYFRKARFNLLMPVSLVLFSIWLWFCADRAISGGHDIMVRWSLMAGLTLLGLVEHVLLVLPLNDSLLWRWAIPARQR